MDGGADASPEAVERGPTEVRHGPFAGWKLWAHDAFETHSGPFYFREEDGAAVCALPCEARHMNGGGFLHGGCALTFADFTLFAIAHQQLGDFRGVTVSLNGDFIGTAVAGDTVEGRGEVVRAGGSLVFIRGMLTNGGAPVLTFSGVIKKVKQAPRPGA